MSRTFPKRAGARIFSASSSPIRLEILRMLLLSGPLSYSEIMQRLKLDPEKQTGRFAYHLRSLQRAHLVEADSRTRRYRATDVGARLVDFAQELDEYALKKEGRLLVRTSRLAIEEFERGRIVGSLVKEAQMPADLAERVGREVEDRLLSLDVKYLTAPLIREIVNAVLVEKGLEEYRHRMTRLGLPVHDVTEVIRVKSKAGLDSESVRREAADSVLKEYVLLNLLPRHVADAHLSGRIHIDNLGTCILKPDYAELHVPRLLEEGDNRLSRGLKLLSLPSNRSLRSALKRLAKTFEAFRPEVNLGQCMSMFNVWLAPYARGLSDAEIEQALAEFVVDLTALSAGPDPSAGLAIGMELEVPEHVAEERASKRFGDYATYQGEAVRLAEAALRVLAGEHAGAPQFGLIPVINLRSAKAIGSSNEVIRLAHSLASERGSALFANVIHTQHEGTYSPDGAFFPSPQGFGRPYIGGVTVNLPRLACLSQGDDGSFEAELENSVGLALDATQVRHSALYDRIHGNLLPYLFEGNGEAPCRFDQAVMAVGFTGLDEATVLHTGRHVHEDANAEGFANRCLCRMARLISDRAERTGEHIYLTQIASFESAERLAALDYQAYGQVTAKARPQSSMINYTTVTILPLEANIPLSDRLRVEGAFSRHADGGHLALVEVADSVTADDLTKATLKIVEKYDVKLYSYTRHLTHCAGCGANLVGWTERCPQCGSFSDLTAHGRVSTRYLPVRYWTPGSLAIARARRRYSTVELSAL